MRFVSDMSAMGKWDGKKFESFEDIGEQFCESFPGYSRKISNIVRFYRDFANKYRGKLVNELEKYGEKIRRKLVVEEDMVKCVDRSA